MLIVLRKDRVFVHPEGPCPNSTERPRSHQCLKARSPLPLMTLGSERRKKEGSEGAGNHLSDSHDATGSSLPEKLEQVTKAAGLVLTDCVT